MLAALLCTVSFIPSADPPSPAEAQAQRIDQLIQQLGHAEFAKREKAYLALESIGGAAYAKLVAAKQSTDPEIRSRATLLADAVRLADFERRVSEFLADTKGERKHQLPGLAAFLQKAGNDAAAREMYASFLRDKNLKNLFMVAEHSPDSLGTAVQSFVQQMQTRNRSAARLPPPGLIVRPAPPAPAAAPNVVAMEGPYTFQEIVGVLLVDSLTSEEARQTRRIGFSISQLLYQTPLRNALLNTDSGKMTAKTDDRGRIARAALGLWFDTRLESSELSMTITYANQYQMQEYVEAAAQKQILSKSATPQMKGMALMGLAKSQGEKAIPTLEKYLKDSTQGATRYETVTDDNGRAIAKQTPIEMRDIALAGILQLKKLNPADYGMKVYSTQDTMKFQSTNCWFSSDEERKKAFAKFEAERKK